MSQCFQKARVLSTLFAVFPIVPVFAGGRDMFKEPGWSDPPMNKQSGALDVFGGKVQHHEMQNSTRFLAQCMPKYYGMS